MKDENKNMDDDNDDDNNPLTDNFDDDDGVYIDADDRWRRGRKVSDNVHLETFSFSFLKDTQKKLFEDNRRIRK